MEKKEHIRKGIGEMKTKLRDFNTNKIPCDLQTYVLKIRHEYPITQFYRTRERFVDKLQEYYWFDIESVIEDKKSSIYTMSIKGKLLCKRYQEESR